MSLEQLSSLAQVFGSIGVIVSLIFVGLQIKQNTGALQRNEHNSTMEQWTVIRMAIAKNRDIAELMVNWSHSLASGRTSFGLGASVGQEWATQERIDGDASLWGFSGAFDHSFADDLDLFLWFAYANESFDDERPDFTTDPDLLLERNDDLWYVGGGLVWQFAPGWTLRPTFEYDWEDSNIPALTYSKTEFWLTARKSF